MTTTTAKRHSTSKFATAPRSKWDIRRQHDPVADHCQCGRCKGRKEDAK